MHLEMEFDNLCDRWHAVVEINYSPNRSADSVCFDDLSVTVLAISNFAYDKTREELGGYAELLDELATNQAHAMLDEWWFRDMLLDI